MAVRAAPLSEYSWLRSRLATSTGDQHFVSELLPPGYERYLRVLDPWHPAQSAEPRRTWADLAREGGLDLYPEISWKELERAARPADRPPSEFLYSGSDPETRRRVVDHLAGVSAGRFYFAFDLVASFLLDREPFVLEADVLDLTEVGRYIAELVGGRLADDPEHWWPSDRAWVVNRDFDLDELYVACDAATFELLSSDPELETLEVRLESRVDWSVDDARRS